MNRRGSALVETAVAAGLAAVLSAAAIGVGRLALDRRRANAVSRYATLLAASGLAPDALRDEVNDYASSLGLRGAVVSTARFTALPSAAFYRLMVAETRARAARPAAFGGGEWIWTDRSVLEEET